MPKVILPSQLTSLAERELRVEGGTIGTVLENLFVKYPQLRSYLVDDQGGLRHHVVAFINGQPVRDKQHLNDPVPSDGEVFLLQALSGGSEG